jgi:mannosyltransferase
VQIAKEGLQPVTTTRPGSAALAHPHILVGALTLLTAGLGFVRLDYRAVHFDESISIDRTDEPWSTLWHAVIHDDPNMSLYYGLLKVWTSVFGDGLVAVRSLSVLAAALCVPVVYAIGVRLFGVAAGLLAGLLMSTNVFFLRYAQEARAYALVALLAALSTYFFLALLDRPRRWNAAGYVTSSVLAFLMHFFAAWVLLVHVVTLAALRGRRALGRTWIACFAAIGALIAPMAYVALTLDEDPIGWLDEPGWGAVAATLAQLAGDSFLHLATLLAICVLALSRAARSRRVAFGLAFTAGWAVLPLLATFAVSQVKPILLAKYLIVSLPAMALLAAGAITSLRPVGWALAAGSVLLALSVPELRSWYEFRGQEDWRTLTSQLVQRKRPGDGVVSNAEYARDSVVDYSNGHVAVSLPVRGGRIATNARGSRVWLVLAHSQNVTETLRATLEPGYRLQSRRVFDGDIATELYVRRTS